MSVDNVYLRYKFWVDLSVTTFCPMVDPNTKLSQTVSVKEKLFYIFWVWDIDQKRSLHY